MLMIKSYNELPVGKYDELVKLTLEAKSETQCKIKLISILSGYPVHILKGMPIARFSQLAKDASFIRETPKPHGHIEKEYHCGTFDLVPTRELETITTAQYVDFEEMTKLEGDHTVEILSVFLVPKGKGYCDGYKAKDVQDAIRDNLSVLDAMSLVNFFTKRWQRLIKNSLTSSERILRKLQKGRLSQEKKEELEAKIAEMKEVMLLLGNGVGFPLSTRWQLLYVLTGILSGR